jgi:hypothetical protein
VFWLLVRLGGCAYLICWLFVFKYSMKARVLLACMYGMRFGLMVPSNWYACGVSFR